MRLSVIKCVCEKSPVVSYHRQQIKPTSDFANGSKSRLLGSGESQYRDISTSKTRTCKRCCIGRHSQNARLERRNASSSGEKIRTATVPGQTLERGKGRNQVAASIKEQNCDRQINKTYRDKMVAYLSSFYGTVSHGHFWSKRIEHKRLSKIHLRSDEYESKKNCPDHMQRRQGILDNAEAILEHGTGRSGCANRQSSVDRALPGPGRSIADHDSTHGAQQGDPDPHRRSVALHTDAQE